MPPSSLYCCQKSVSRVSSADKNRRMAASPGVRPPLSASAKAGIPLANSPAPRVPAPATATPLRKKDRRLVERFDGCVVCSIIFSFCACCAWCSLHLLVVVTLVHPEKHGPRPYAL